MLLRSFSSLTFDDYLTQTTSVIQKNKKFSFILKFFIQIDVEQ